MVSGRAEVNLTLTSDIYIHNLGNKYNTSKIIRLSLTDIKLYFCVVMKNSQNNLLFDKLNRFINKYYKNKILKGLIFLFATLLIFLLFFSVIEYISRFNTFGRSILFLGILLIKYGYIN